jgi:very-short-patch-repair endonuclease
VVRPELCALHLFAVCRRERAERLVDGLWSARLLSGRSLGALLAQLGEMGRNGTAGLRAYLDDRPGDYVPPASGLETRVADILRSAGITVRRQVDLGTDGVWSGRVDFLVDGQPIVIEVQSERHHAALSDRRADAARRAGLEAAGFVWVEVWDHEVWGTPALVVARVRAAIGRLSLR